MWKPITSDKPERGKIAMTKISDEKGDRNEQELRRGKDINLWWTPDGVMYVYYNPTHYFDN